uniref:ANK_REP_REGION domain-containing protein n=1 Tax=Macrostomum lignano TaxID=282301 RepID=A0A1I8JFU4_9PLAT
YRDIVDRSYSNTGATVFEVAAEVLSADSLKSYILDFQLDRRRNTVLHYAAAVEGSSLLLDAIDIIRNAGKSPKACLRYRNNDSKNVFDIAAEHCRADTLKSLVSKSGIQLSDDEIKGIFHCLAKNKNATFDVFKSLSEQLQLPNDKYDWIGWRNQSDETVLHVAAANCYDQGTLWKLFEHAPDEVIVSKDLIHYQAKNKRAQCKLDDFVPAMSWMNNENQGVLHFLAENSCSKKLLEEIAGPKYYEHRRKDVDSNGNTLWHYLAKNRLAESVMLSAKCYERIGESIFQTNFWTWANNDKKTVLHVAAENFSAQTMKQLFDRFGQDCIELRDNNGDTVMHCLARNATAALEIFALSKYGGPRCLKWKNNLDRTVLDIAESSNNSAERLVWISEGYTVYRWDLTDSTKKLMRMSECYDKILADETESVKHIQQRQPASEVMQDSMQEDTENNAEQTKTAQDEERNETNGEKEKSRAICSAFQKFGTNCLSWENGDGITLLQVAVRVCKSEVAKAFLTDIFSLRGDSFSHRDSWGNTWAHIAAIGSVDMESDAFSLVNERAECLFWRNNEGQSVLHFAIKNVKIFQKLMTALKISGKAKASTLAKNSALSSLLSAVDSEEKLKNLIGPLEKLLRMPGRDLLHLTVPGGMHKGATCLHFACKAEHKANIKYLIDEQLQLSAETDSGWSCIGFALENYTIDQIERNLSTLKIKIEGAELWRLIDPAKRALALPDRSTARQVCKDTTEKSKLAGHGSSLALLIEAFEMDNSNVLRSAFCLNKITDKEERLLLKHLENSTGYEGLFSGEELSDAHCELSIIDAAVFEFEKRKIKEEILPDLLLTRQFELIPACVSLLIRLKTMVYRSKGKVGQEKLLGLYNKVTGITVNALDGLYNNADRNGKRLLMKYMRGKLPSEDAPREKQGPKFPCRPAAKEGKVKYCTVMEMIEDAAINDLFATDCVYHLVQKNWSSKLRGDKGGRRCRGTNFTANLRFGFHFASFIAFMIYFAWYVTDFPKTFQYWPPDLVLVAYAASLTMQEFTEFLRRSKVVNVYTACGIRHCPVYVRDTFNFFDCLALLFMWAGLVLKLLMWGCLPGNPRAPGLCVISSGKFIQANAARGLTNEPLVPIQVQYTCQMILSSSFLLWGFRSVSFFNRFQRIGPVISMLRSLIIQDLFPFLLIILVIFYSFGVFFFNLLFPAVTAMPSSTNTTEYQLNAALQIITMPLNLMFTNFDRTGFESADAEKSQTVGSIAHAVGNRWFNNLMLFIFLILSNIVMLNLLIARFNLTVIKMHSKALGIWRTTYYEMLQEYKNISFLPPPFSFLEYPIRICLWCCKRIAQKKNKVASGKTCFYWFPSEYPDEYREFLKFQATQLRSIRPSLSLEVTRNKSDTDILMAHTENVSAATVRELQECLQRLETKVEAIEENRANRKKQRSERHKQRKKDLSKIISKLEQLAPNQNSSRD